MTTQPPATDTQKAQEAGDPALKGWPHQAIQDLDEGEREALLKSGGPVGEMARLAWQQHQHQKDLAEGKVEGNRATGPGSGAGEQESQPAPPAGTNREYTADDVEAARQRIAAGGQGPPASDSEAKTVEEARDHIAMQGGTAPYPGSTIQPPADISTTSTSGTTAPAEPTASPAASGMTREDAEQIAAQRGYTIRDWGTSGDWRVVDGSGQVVSRDVLL